MLCVIALLGGYMVGEMLPVVVCCTDATCPVNCVDCIVVNTDDFDTKMDDD